MKKKNKTGQHCVLKRLVRFLLTDRCFGENKEKIFLSIKKKCKKYSYLFDKRGSFLSIIKVDRGGI